MIHKIVASLDTDIRFDFEAFLQKHFGLVGPLFTGLSYDEAEDKAEEARAQGAGYDDPEAEVYFYLYTKAGWDAWTRACNLFYDMEKLGIIDENICAHICERFCDNA